MQSSLNEGHTTWDASSFRHEKVRSMHGPWSRLRQRFPLDSRQGPSSIALLGWSRLPAWRLSPRKDALPLVAHKPQPSLKVSKKKATVQEGQCHRPTAISPHELARLPPAAFHTDLICQKANEMAQSQAVPKWCG
jgi:hypothetical protein